MADRRGFFRKALGIPQGPPTPIGEASAAANVAKAASSQLGGILGSIAGALERPIYTNVTTTTKTWTTSDGRVIQETTTEGWTIPLGLPVLVVGTIMIWEVGLAFAKAFGISKGGNPSEFQTAEGLLDPSAWIAYQVAAGAAGTGAAAAEFGVFGGVGGLLTYLIGAKVQSAKSSDGSTTTTVTLPPTFMAMLSAVASGALSPVLAGMNRLLGIVKKDH